MAVEKMEMLSLVSELEHMDPILKDIVLFGNVQMVSALHEIEGSQFSKFLDENKRVDIMKTCAYELCKEVEDHRSAFEKIERVMQIVGLPKKASTKLIEKDNQEFRTVEFTVSELHAEAERINRLVKQLTEERKHLEYLKAFQYLADINLDLKKLFEMSSFGLKLGLMTYENRERLAMNYENINAIIMHLGEVKGQAAVLVVYPYDLTLETERLLRSVYFEDVAVPSEYWLDTKTAAEKIKFKSEEVENRLKSLNNDLIDFKNNNKEKIYICYNLILLENIKNKMKKQIVVSRNFFYLAGWMPSRLKEDFDKRIARLETNAVTVYNDHSLINESILPPTELHNNWLFKPFEALVKLYGVPSYNEMDPTPFFAIVYMLFFGSMFGDLGQGFVFVLAGLVLTLTKKNIMAGSLLSRLGVSSMLFGILYDSFFGYEHIISGVAEKIFGSGVETFFVRPLENMETVLITSVGVGVILLFIAFGFGIFNKLKNKHYAEGLYGRNGVAGFIFYICLLTIIGSVAGFISGLPMLLIYFVAFIMLLSIVFREPLANLMTGHRPLHHEALVDYYVESVFDAIETILTLFSNTLSFIRIGAFAMNHVGLFMAFHTIAALIGGLIGEVSMFIVGNIIIIVLEGLIVFIQGLRLMFYELFGKYYTGEGSDYQPVRFEF